ncbi:PE family protein [Nocardia sp. NPDC127526]|uniref:PE family protein n=1 Tax=Nocardia sp. NPDC127526 TaxID=3345393 RepID=UPI00363046DA
MGTTITVDPERLRAAAARIDRLACQLDERLRAAAPGLRPPPAGADEVSVHAANTLGTVASSYLDDVRTCLGELRTIAAALHRSSRTVERTEDGAAAALRAH